jgi:hypothetical protein
MHQSWSCKLPIHKARHRTNCIKAEPKHQILWTIPTVDCDNFIYTNSQVVHQPVPHPCNAFEELSVCPRLAFEHEERGVRVIAQGLVFKNVVVQDALASDAIRNHLYDVWGGSEAAACVLQVVYNVEFGIEVGC